jgi:hypothetical protein
MTLKKDEGFQSLEMLFSMPKAPEKKPPAYQWQDLALRVVKELLIPPFKKASVFKICRDNSKEFVEMCLTDTKELCKSGDRWKYFFKVVDNKLKGPEKD